MTAKDRSELDRVKLTFEYQESEEEFNALTERIRLKKRRRTLAKKEDAKYSSKWFARENKRQLKELPQKYTKENR